MKRLIFSCTIVCFSLLGKGRGIADAYNNIPTKPHATNILHNAEALANTNSVPSLPLIETVPVVNNPVETVSQIATSITNNIAEQNPVADTTQALPSIDLTTVTNVLPELRLLNLVPLLPANDIVPLEDITQIPNIVSGSPVLVVTNLLPTDLSTVETIIQEELKKTDVVACYKTTAQNKAYLIFAPKSTYKNPLYSVYETIITLVSAISDKLQVLFEKNQSEVDTTFLYDQTENQQENKE